MLKFTMIKVFKKFRHKKSFLLSGMAVLLVISLFASGYLFVSNESLKNQLTNQAELSQASANSLDSFEKELERLKKDLEESQENLPAAIAPDGIRVRDEAGRTISYEAEAEKAANPTLPQISVEPTTVDLGTISQTGGMAKSIFKITNTGGSDLMIYSSFSSCGCTTAPIKNKTLTPNESVDLEVEYDPNYFTGLLGQGEIEKRITIVSNDPDDAFYKVYLKANVTP